MKISTTGVIHMKRKFRLISTFLISLCFLLTIFATSANALIDSGQASSYSVLESPEKFLATTTTTTTTLTTREQQIYNKIYNSIINLSASVMLDTLSPLPEAYADVFPILGKVIADHPEIFYFSYTGTTYWSNGNLVLAYTDTKENLLPLIAGFNSKVDEIIAKTISNDMTTLEKELAIHDYIVLNTAYDKYNLDNKSLPPESYDAYGILMKNTGVCQGYAEAFKLLLNKVGIESIVISSAEMNHAWNIVTIDNKKYHVDVTWDDPLPDRRNIISYNYFNLSDETIKDVNHTHRWVYTDYSPCTTTNYEFLANMDFVNRVGQTFYYTDSKNHSLNKINLDGNSQTTLVSSPSLYTVYHNNWIYYSDYSNSAYIYRVRPDGSNKELLKNVSSINLHIADGKLYYSNYNTNVESYLNIPNYNVFDLNSDNSVDITDLAILSSKYNKIKPSPYYEYSNDLNPDGIIDIYDVVMLSKEIV
jgi:hypothetical protein